MNVMNERKTRITIWSHRPKQRDDSVALRLQRNYLLMLEFVVRCVRSVLNEPFSTFFLTPLMVPLVVPLSVAKRRNQLSMGSGVMLKKSITVTQRRLKEILLNVLQKTHHFELKGFDGTDRRLALTTTELREILGAEMRVGSWPNYLIRDVHIVEVEKKRIVYRRVF